MRAPPGSTPKPGLRCYLSWCADRGLDPLAARRPHLELHIRWIQQIRRFKPSTVSRRLSVVTGFDKTCVIDGLLEHSPAEHARRPAVPGYTDSFEIICRDCGDDPRWEYQDAPPRLQRLRGPYWLMAGTAKYVAHIQWHEKLIHARR